MEGILPELRWSEKERIRKKLRECRDAGLKTRYLIIVNLLNGRSVVDTVKSLEVGRSTVYDVAKRFRESREAGLVDGRTTKGRHKLKETYLEQLSIVVAACAQDFGWRRPTWTRELLVKTLARQTGVWIHVSTMSTALKLIGARLGRPKPMVGCPWSERRKKKRLREIQTLIDSLPDDEVAVYEDEVDIHLNPKIGVDWMVSGEQKEVMTPGKNVKNYLAGAVDTRTKELIWVESDKKDTMLFIELLWKLVQHYADAKVIHVVLDNYCIHSTNEVEISLQTEQGRRLRLHFLPPYCPDHNRIERVWRDLHADVTRNHRCENMQSLMTEVRYWLRKRNRKSEKALAA